MKQLTQSEIRKNGKVYKNVSSPETSGTMKQVTDIVEKDGTFSISTDGGKTYSPAVGAVPEALPQEASALKSGNLPTSGWNTTNPAMYAYTITDISITANSDILMELTDDGGVKSYSMEAGKMTVIRDTVPTQPIPYTYKVKQTNASGQFTLVNHFVPSVPESPTSLPVTYKKASGELPTSGWTTLDEGWKGNTLPANTDWKSVTYGDGKYVAVAFNSDKGAYSTDGITWTEMSMPASRDWASVTYGDGKFVAVAQSSANGAYWKAAAQVTYSITDTFITANTSVKMFLTDAGGVKAQSKANGSITVIRDEVPTTAIPYEYEVEQTSDEGLFEVINAYVPNVPDEIVTSVNGQTGAVTVAVPTKTSELTNDSGFVTSADVPTKTSQLENDSGFLTKNNIVAGDNVTVTDENGNVKISATGGGSGGGGIGDWQNGTKDTELADGTYIISFTVYDIETASIINIINGGCAPTIMYAETSGQETATGMFAAYLFEFTNKKVQPAHAVDIRKYDSGSIDILNMIIAEVTANYKYIKIK